MLDTNKGLPDYVNEQRKRGLSDDAIKTILQNTGHSSVEIENAMNASQADPPQAVPDEQVPAAAVTAEGQQQEQQGMITESVSSPKLKWIVIAVIAGILIVGGIASAYYFYNASNNLSSDQVIGAMMQNLLSKVSSASTAESFSLVTNYDYKSLAATGTENPYAAMFLGAGSSTFSLSMNASGSFDISDPNNRKFDQKFLITLGGAAQNMTLTLGAELRIIGSELYAQVTNIPNLGFFNPASLENKWIEVDINSSTPGLATNGSFSLASATLSQDETNNIAAALKETFQISKTLPSETVDGVSSYHYEYTIDKQGLKDLVHALVAIAPATTTSQIAEANADSFIDELQNAGGELVIGKKDLLPRELSFDFTIATTTYGYETNSQFSMTTTYANINGSQNIEVPSGAERLDQAIKDMSGVTPSATYPTTTSPVSVKVSTNTAQNSPSASQSNIASVTLEPAAGDTYLEGSSYKITWFSPAWAEGLPVSLELYKGTSPCAYNNRYGPTAKACGLNAGSGPIYSSSNDAGAFAWKVPLNLLSGDGYSVVLFFNGAISAQSASFSIQ